MSLPILVNKPVEKDDSGSDIPRAYLLASPWHTVFVLLVLGLYAYWATIRAARAQAGLGPSRPTMYLRTIFFELLFLGIVVAGVKLRGGSLQSVLGQRWKSVGQVFADLGLGIGLLILSTLLVSILGGHQNAGAANQSVQFLLPLTSLETGLWMLLSITAGICEEAIYRGYLQRQLGALTRNAWVGIAISAAAFGGAHLYQGVRRATVIAVSGVLFGWFAEWRKTVRPGMFAHALQDGIAPLLLKVARR
ncbi:MAG TPA: type II CAAX endopeptidase family protein [Candidatus Dormibacteraeota bacterium]|nr:type II CAAX endopeptidase family protein [Candidatus Dormibacteraeota bacterium]